MGDAVVQWLVYVRRCMLSARARHVRERSWRGIVYTWGAITMLSFTFYLLLAPFGDYK